MFTLSACNKKKAASGDVASSNNKENVQQGLTPDEQRALQSEEELAADRSITIDNMQSELDKLKAEIDADK